MAAPRLFLCPNRSASPASLGVAAAGGSGVGGNRNTTVSYYGKGAVVGLVLDAHIRRLTAGRRSFDDELWIYFTMRRRNLTGLQKVFWCGLVDLLLARLPPREDRRLRAHGRLDDDGGSDPWTREAPLLAGLAAASCRE